MSRFLPLVKIIINELREKNPSQRISEPISNRESEAELKLLQSAIHQSGPVCGQHYFMMRELLARIKPGMIVVDISSGTGAFLMDLAELCPETKFIGFDSSSAAANVANDSRQARGLENVRFVVGNSQNLEMIDNQSVDFVMSTMSLHHLPTSVNLRNSLNEVNRILKENGNMFLIDFARMRSGQNMDIVVHSTAASDEKIFHLDMINSMRAAFSLQDFAMASSVLKERKVQVSATLIPSIVVLHTGRKSELQKASKSILRKHWSSLPVNQKVSTLAVHVLLKLGNLISL